ncbi:hypothetical protein HYT57_02795 [Candidatus Woesearchaeota archaeon]|nr:hypothetical protein [Candidatus Woesearchaeota archaeon]
MLLAHTTDDDHVLLVLTEGLKPSRETGRRNYGESNPDYIYLSTLPKLTSFYDSWGNYQFYLNMDFFRTHVDQFKAYHRDSQPNFNDFIKRCGIEEIAFGWGDDDAISNQIVSLKPVPVWALHTLVVNYSDDLIVNGHSKTEWRKVRLRDLSPPHMKLFLPDIHTRKLKRIRRSIKDS